MHLVKSLFVGASVVVAAIAQSGKLGFTTVPTSVIAGTPTDLKWSGGDGSAVTITLKQGTPDNLKTIAIITGSATGDSFTWTPPKSLADGQDYAFQISQGVSDINYSGLFSLTGGSNAPESSKLTASSKTSASVASSKTSASVESSKTSASKSTASVASVTSSLSSIFSSISAVSRNNTHVTTTVAPINATSSILIGTGFGTAVSSGGTGIPISRNTTLSHATLKSSSTKTESTTSSGPASTEASSTGTSPSASTSGKPNSAANLASPLAFIITAFVAIIYLG